MKIFKLLFLSLLVVGCSFSSLEKGLISYHPIKGSAKDLSTNSLDGVLGKDEGSVDPKLVEDRFGRENEAYSLNGSNYIDLSESPVYNLGDYAEFSISVWVNPSDTTNGIILSKYISAGNNRMWFLRFWQENIRFGAFNGIYENSDIMNTPRLKGWQLLTIVLAKDVYTLYVNGRPATSTPKTVDLLKQSPTCKTLIGAVHFSNKLFDRKYNGDVDEVRFYQRALSQKEVKRLYKLK